MRLSVDEQGTFTVDGEGDLILGRRHEGAALTVKNDNFAAVITHCNFYEIHGGGPFRSRWEQTKAALRFIWGGFLRTR